MTIVHRSYYRMSKMYSGMKEVVYHLGGLTETVVVTRVPIDIQISTKVNPFPEFNLDPFLFPEAGLKCVFLKTRI